MSASSITALLRAKAAKLQAFMNEHTDRIDFEVYDALRETDAELRVLADFLEQEDALVFIEERISIANIELRLYSEYLGVDLEATAEEGGAP